jgi:oxygen-independent coproporphyrinogen-3 oxidase
MKDVPEMTGPVFGVYIHIPFCRTLCPYCDFVRQPIAGNVPATFVDALCREIAEFEGPDEASSVFFGGGTPSLLDPGSLERILTAVRDRFRLDGAEISVEANPDDVRADLADVWRSLGVNRVSLGVQSFDEHVLRYLGRRHDAEGARRACVIVAERFENWGMDLIFGARPVEAWAATLSECVRFAPRHVSAYGLTYEAGTPFSARVNDAADDSVWLDLYREASAALSVYDHYEISNFCMPGYACRHNLVYWRNLEYAGFGPGAYAFVDGVRARNAVALDDYLAAPGHKVEALALTQDEIRIETVIQHCRLREGLSKAVYLERFGHTLDEDFGPRIQSLIQRGLLEQDADTVRPTTLGFELNNEIGLALV